MVFVRVIRKVGSGVMIVWRIISVNEISVVCGFQVVINFLICCGFREVNVVRFCCRKVCLSGNYSQVVRVVVIMMVRVSWVWCR